MTLTQAGKGVLNRQDDVLRPTRCAGDLWTRFLTGRSLARVGRREDLVGERPDVRLLVLLATLPKR